MIITLGIQRIFNFLHLNISMHILQTVLHTFFKVLTRTIYLKQSLASLVGDHFLYSHDLNVWSRVILEGEIRFWQQFKIPKINLTFNSLCVKNGRQILSCWTLLPFLQEKFILEVFMFPKLFHCPVCDTVLKDFHNNS